MTHRIALATAAAWATLPDDDRLLLVPLAVRGVRAEAVVWSDDAARWADYDAVVIRSCWDYHRRAAEFLAWIDRLTAAGIRVLNPPDIVRWNANKSYLRDLAAAAVTTVPTAFVEPGDPTTLHDLLALRGWHSVVVKPVVSASAHDTWRADTTDASARESDFRASLARGAVMVQPFIPQIARDGEWSLVFLGGAFSHAALKRPRDGDFRVQAEHGGSSVRATPSQVLVAQAGSIVTRFAPGCVYARVDGVAIDGALVLMELELVEPSLFLGLTEHAAGRFATAIVATISAPTTSGAPRRA